MGKSTGKPKERHSTDSDEPKKIRRRQAPGKTIQSRENQIIRLAYDEAERRIKAHTASSQEITHFLKQGSTIALLEKARLEQENLLLQAKTDQLKSQKRVEELYANALAAMRTYSGQEGQEDEED
jgi:YD repeat-containing protein